VIILLVVVVAIAIYFIPTFIAHQRNVENASRITQINGYWGWTVVGWAIALKMSLSSPRAKVSPSRTTWDEAPPLDEDENYMESEAYQIRDGMGAREARAEEDVAIHDEQETESSDNLYGHDMWQAEEGHTGRDPKD
jgi:hypothetical protein